MNDFQTTTARRAAKTHRCYECGRNIDPGETYSSTSGCWDGSFSSFKTCAHCEILRKVIASRDQCFFEESYFGGLSEYDAGGLRETAIDESDYLVLLRLWVQFSKRWSTKNGQVVPPPRVRLCEIRGQWGYDAGPNGEPAQGKSWVRWDWYDSSGDKVPGKTSVQRFAR